MRPLPPYRPRRLHLVRWCPRPPRLLGIRSLLGAPARSGFLSVLGPSPTLACVNAFGWRGWPSVLADALCRYLRLMPSADAHGRCLRPALLADAFDQRCWPSMWPIPSADTFGRLLRQMPSAQVIGNCRRSPLLACLLPRTLKAPGGQTPAALLSTASPSAPSPPAASHSAYPASFGYLAAFGDVSSQISILVLPCLHSINGVTGLDLQCDPHARNVSTKIYLWTLACAFISSVVSLAGTSHVIVLPVSVFTTHCIVKFAINDAAGFDLQCDR